MSRMTAWDPSARLIAKFTSRLGWPKEGHFKIYPAGCPAVAVVVRAGIPGALGHSLRATGSPGNANPRDGDLKPYSVHCAHLTDKPKICAYCFGYMWGT